MELSCYVLSVVEETKPAMPSVTTGGYDMVDNGKKDSSCARGRQESTPHGGGAAEQTDQCC